MKEFERAEGDTAADAGPVLIDLPAVAGTVQWCGGVQLEHKLHTHARQGHATCVVCFSDLGGFFDGVSRVETAVVAVLVYGDYVLATTIGGSGGCVRCFQQRLCQTIPSLAYRLEHGHSLIEPASSLVNAVLGTIGALLVPRLRAATPRRMVALDLRRGEIWDEVVVPTTTCTCSFVSEAQIESGLGRFGGLTRAIGHPSAVAEALSVYATATTSGQRGGGAAAGRRLDAPVRALAELVERRAARNVFALATEGRWSDQRSPAPIENLRPFAPDQYRRPGFPYIELAEETVTHWVTARRLRDGTEHQIPAQLVSLDLRTASPPIAPMRSTGIAAASTFARAADRAVLELVERDVVTRSWLEAAVVRVSDSGISDRLPPGFRYLHWMPTIEIAAPVVMSLLVDRSGRGALGYSAGATFAEAAEGSTRDARLMYVHLDERGLLLTPPDDLDTSLASPPTQSTIDWPLLMTRYDPAVIDVSSREAQFLGLYVVAAYSSSAVDVPARPTVIPEAVWMPENTRLLEARLRYLRPSP